MKKIYKHLLSLSIIALLLTPIFAFQIGTTHAQNTIVEGMDKVDDGLEGILGKEDPRTVVGRIINVALGFLGVIAVGIILVGGFKWMTAGGNEDKAGDARKLIGAGVIGLAIILSAWAIATFVLGRLHEATSGI